MKEKLFNISVPSKVMMGFRWREGEVTERIREVLVMDLLRRGRLSEAEAASILGLDRWELIEVMGYHRVPAIHLSRKSLKQEALGNAR